MALLMCVCVRVCVCVCVCVCKNRAKESAGIKRMTPEGLLPQKRRAVLLDGARMMVPFSRILSTVK